MISSFNTINDIKMYSTYTVRFKYYDAPIY